MKTIRKVTALSLTVGLSLVALSAPVHADTFAYVTNRDSDNVSVINTATNALYTTVAVGVWPLFVAITPDGAFAYVTNRNSHNVSVINRLTNEVEATVAVTAPNEVAITPDGAFAYVTNFFSDYVSEINTATNVVEATVMVGNSPVGVAITPVSITPKQTFADVPRDYWAFSFIMTLSDSGITSGCGGSNYCPNDPVTRAEMAMFLERGLNGSTFNPPAATGNTFLDVGASDFAAAFIAVLISET